MIIILIIFIYKVRKNNILIDDGNETFLIANNIRNTTYKNKFKNLTLVY